MPHKSGLAGAAGALCFYHKVEGKHYHHQQQHYAAGALVLVLGKAGKGPREHAVRIRLNVDCGRIGRGLNFCAFCLHCRAFLLKSDTIGWHLLHGAAGVRHASGSGTLLAEDVDIGFVGAMIVIHGLIIRI